MTDTEDQTRPPRRPGYPSVAALEEALVLLGSGAGYGPEPPMAALAAPQATPELLGWLRHHAPLPVLTVQCYCGRRLGKWEELGGHVMPVYKRPKQFGPQGGIAYTERLAAGFGPIRDSYTQDARGTITYACACGEAVVPLRAETRMKLYVQALLDNSTTVLIG